MASGGRTACAGPVYHFDARSSSTTKFPAAYDRTLFAYEWSRHWILAIHMDEENHIERLERFLPEVEFKRPIDMQFDAGGSLYVIEYGETWGENADARLVRIDYVRGNRSPVAVASLLNDVGREPLTVELSAEGSHDKDGDSLTYQWAMFRNGVENPKREVVATGKQGEITFDRPGVYTIELTVTDASGASGTTTSPVIVGNARPEVKFLKPRPGDFFKPGEPIRYQLVVRDVEDGTSDFDEAEEEDWHLIEGLAPTRLFVEAIPVADDASAVDEPPGLTLIRKSDCLNCHVANRRLVGPSFVEIADKYRNQPHQIEKTVARVREGSTGVWGKIGMLPHQQHTDAEVLQMVEYVFSVTGENANPTVQGFNNQIIAGETVGGLRLEATYTDLGRAEIPRLIGTASITLRNRHLQAEEADEFQGTQALGSDKAEGKRFMGAINHDAFLLFKNIPFDDLQSVTVRVTSAGSGGTIEARRGSPNGTLLGSVEVEVNGSWDAFYDKSFDLTPSSGRDSLYLVFKNEKNRGGLMNIDSVQLNN
ncbi:MAG: carbohydrate-binding protein [Pirellulaceae bacterium]